MRNYQRSIALFLVGIAVVGVTALAAISSQRDREDKSKGPKKSPQMIEAESKLPMVDFDGPEPVDPRKQQKIFARGKKYDKSELGIDPSSDAVMSLEHWATGLPAIPVDESDVVVVGNVVAAQAHLTEGKVRVFSEFTILVSEILKNDSESQIQVNDSIDADRFGGRVRFAGGRVGLYFIGGQGMPQVGKQYLLFLTTSGGKDDYHILTGYELRDGQVHLLDNPAGGHPISLREGADAASFLNEVRAAVGNP
jgi:hypothetical protein